jgi:hypothetical protein
MGLSHRGANFPPTTLYESVVLCCPLSSHIPSSPLLVLILDERCLLGLS